MEWRSRYAFYVLYIWNILKVNELLMERVCLWSVLLGVLLMIIVLIIERLLKSLSQLLLTGRAELLAQAAQLLPPTTRYDTQNSAGLTALMIASIRNDEVALHALLDAGCDPNVEVPPAGSAGYPAIQPDTQHWTALSFAASRANYVALRILLERGGKVEGGARSSEEKCTLTPLQLAAGTGNLEIVALLLAHGANAFLSTQQKDSLCFAGSAQKGCFCAISVAAAHGHRSCLRKLLTHPVSPGTRDVLSLEEMLAEGDVGAVRGSGGPTGAGGPNSASASGNNEDILPLLNKTQIKRLQEAMYHSAENNHLGRFTWNRFIKWDTRICVSFLYL